jgi:hypothetical protein
VKRLFFVLGCMAAVAFLLLGTSRLADLVVRNHWDTRYLLGGIIVAFVGLLAFTLTTEDMEI